MATGGATNSSQFGQTSLIIGVVVLVITGLLYGGVTYLKRAQEKKIASVKLEINNLKKSLDTNKDFKAVYDFQDRLFEIVNIQKDKVKQVDILNKLSQATLGASTMTDLKVNIQGGVGDVTASLKVPDLITVAKQINAYRDISKQGYVNFKNSNAKDDNMNTTIEFTLSGAGTSGDDNGVNKF